MKSHGRKKFRDVVHASTPKKKHDNGKSLFINKRYTSSNGRFLHCHVSFARCMLDVSSLGGILILVHFFEFHGFISLQGSSLGCEMPVAF